MTMYLELLCFIIRGQGNEVLDWYLNQTHIDFELVKKCGFINSFDVEFLDYSYLNIFQHKYG